MRDISEHGLQSPAGDDAQDYLKLKADVTRAVSRTCPSWLVDRRDDLVQVAMLRIMDIQKKSEGNRELSSSYLYRVAYTALVDEIRRIRRRREVALEEDGGVKERAVTHDDPERSAASAQIGRGIQECLAAMKRERRLAVALHLQGHKTNEAARLLAWGEKRTENLVYRGLADLRQCLERKGLSP